MIKDPGFIAALNQLRNDAEGDFGWGVIANRESDGAYKIVLFLW